jgi:hypothetical protein
VTRNNQIGQAYLRWLRTRTDYPVWDMFLTGPTAIVGGQSVTDAELRDVLPWLDAHQLIDGVRVDQMDIPVRLSLTPTGRICVMDFDGDVHQWSQRHTGTVTDNSVTVHAGHTAQIAAHAQNVTRHQQTGLVDIDKLRTAATAVREILPLLGLPEQQRSDVKRATEEIATEAENPTPDQGKLHRAAQVLKNLAAAGAIGYNHREHDRDRRARRPALTDLCGLATAVRRKQTGPPADPLNCDCAAVLPGRSRASDDRFSLNTVWATGVW